MVMGTGLAMNTGNKNYHVWVMSKVPKIIAENLQCGPNPKVGVVQLLTVLALNIA